MTARIILLLAAAASLALSAGCVRRTMTFNTDPQGAIVHLNDEEIGRTPVTTDFTWYGDYDVIYRKEGYLALATHHRVRPPWYQRWPIDFVAEVLVPLEFHDRHDVPAETMTLAPEPDLDALILRANQMRDRTLTSDQ